jgi:IPT/TIG domain
MNAVPAIANLTPSTAIAGAGDLSITVAGIGFVSGSSVQFNGMALKTTFTSATALAATVPAADLTNGSIAAVTVSSPSPGGGVSAAASFTVDNPPPVVKSISPASVMAGSGATTIDIAGAGFVPSSVVNWNGAALSTVLVSSSEMKASLPAPSLSSGSVAMVTVSNPVPGGGASSAVTFDVTSPVPVVTSISPKLVAAGAAATIALMGTGFEANSVVLWNGSARTTTFVSATTLQVVLIAADLQNASVGSLTVSNPGPGGSTSGSTPLTVTPPVPTITGVTITSLPANLLPGSDACSVLQVAVSGTNFVSNSMIKVNGMALQNLDYAGDLSTIFNVLPAGFQSKPGALSFTVTNPDPSTTTSAPFAYPATNPPVIAICPTPPAPAVLPSSTFTIAVRSTEVNAGGGEQLTVGALPAGLTVSNTTVPLPLSGAVLHFQAASSIAAGTDNIALTSTAGSATGVGTLALTVNPNLRPSLSFVGPLSTALAVPIGGSGSIQYDTSAQPATAEFDITSSLSGLPPGTTATISPTVFSHGQIVTVTVTAAANAPVTQNAVVTLTGTPLGGVSPVTTTFRLDVTQPPGSLPNNRTDYTSTAGQPFAAVYDSVHDLIFSSNPSWNRVDVLSNKTHRLSRAFPC